MIWLKIRICTKVTRHLIRHAHLPSQITCLREIIFYALSYAGQRPSIALVGPLPAVQESWCTGSFNSVRERYCPAEGLTQQHKTQNFCSKGDPLQKDCILFFCHKAESYLSAVLLDNKLLCLEGKTTSFLKLENNHRAFRMTTILFPLRTRSCEVGTRRIG